MTVGEAGELVVAASRRSTGARSATTRNPLAKAVTRLRQQRIEDKRRKARDKERKREAEE
jgi:hypothetical protein